MAHLPVFPNPLPPSQSLLPAVNPSQERGSYRGFEGGDASGGRHQWRTTTMEGRGEAASMVGNDGGETTAGKRKGREGGEGGLQLQQQQTEERGRGLTETGRKRAKVVSKEDRNGRGRKKAVLAMEEAVTMNENEDGFTEVEDEVKRERRERTERAEAGERRTVELVERKMEEI